MMVVEEEEDEEFIQNRTRTGRDYYRGGTTTHTDTRRTFFDICRDQPHTTIKKNRLGVTSAVSPSRTSSRTLPTIQGS